MTADSAASQVVVIERGFLTPKEIWRAPSCQRTLEPIEVESMIRGAWSTSLQHLSRRGLIELSLLPDGSPGGPPVSRPVQGSQKAIAGVFDITFETDGAVRVGLRAERCQSILGKPTRPSRTLARLEPWKPLRVLLNGRLASSAGQHYVLCDYYFALCADSASPELLPIRFLDLQADLF